MKLLVKIGGSLLDEPARQARIAVQLAQIAREHQTAIVHGGGKQVTRFLEAQGIESSFVNGMRVSDAAVIDAVTKVIAGSVNKNLVAALIAAGQPAVGISGVDGLLTSAVQLAPEMEFVGRPDRSDARLLNLLVTSGYLPVVACIAGDSTGAIFNVNADQMAVSCAAGWQADKLIFLTDVPGVKNARGDVLPRLATSDVRELISDGVAHGGMQAKLEAASSALASNVAEVIIASGDEPNVCSRLLTGEALGTRLIAEGEKALHA